MSPSRQLGNYNAKLLRFKKSQDWRAARSTIYTMIRQGLTPNCLSFNLVISALAQAGQLDSVDQMYSSMQQVSVKPDVFTFTTLISAHGKANRFHQACSFFMQIQAQGIAPNNASYNAMIDACARSGNFLAAASVLVIMKEAGCMPTATTFACLLHGLARTSISKTMVLLRHLLRLDVDVNQATFDGLLRECTATKQMDVALQLLDMMDTRGLHPRPETWKALVLAQAHTIASSAMPAASAGSPQTCLMSTLTVHSPRSMMSQAALPLAAPRPARPQTPPAQISTTAPSLSQRICPFSFLPPDQSNHRFH